VHRPSLPTARGICKTRRGRPQPRRNRPCA
jgi:hypothetical protein